MYLPSPRGAAAYQQTQVQCGTPLELVVKLYDGAIGNLVRAREALVTGDLRKKRDAVSRALAVVSELQNSLDLDAGGEIAESLDRLYRYIRGRILEFNAKRNVKALDEAQELMSTLREGWQQIANESVASKKTP
jgi:flagellar secretion chaperone FliS